MNIPILSINDISSIVIPEDSYTGISVRYHEILRKDILSLFRYGILNLHGGELPRYRGVGVANLSILHDIKRGAGTIHYIDEGVDTGDVIYRHFYDIDDNDSAYDVFLKNIEALKNAFMQIIDKIIDGSLPRISQSELIKQGETTSTYRKKNIIKLKQIPTDATLDDLYRYARAFYFPGHEPAYFLKGEKKVYVSIGNIW